MNLAGYPTFRSTVLSVTGIDLDCYKGSQMERRLQAIMRRVGADDLLQYSRMLQADTIRVKEFRDFLTINVTEFFRNPDKFEELRQAVLPELLRRFQRLVMWSAGCSTGAEPYSLAITLDELDPTGQHEVLATDIDEEALKAARNGAFLERDMLEVNPQRRQRYFTQDGDHWVVRPEIRAKVKFRQQNLLSDAFPADVDLILCRNVVIYFSEEAKFELYRRFHRALKPGGILFVGGTESLLKARELGYAAAAPFFYRAVK